MLSNKELLDLAKYYDLELNSITLKNELPKRINPGIHIYNLDSSDEYGQATGTHWTCSVSDNQRCIYFDSFGAPAPIEIDQFIKKKYNTYGINNWMIQGKESDKCGFYVIALCLYMTYLNETNIYDGFNNFVNNFKDNTKRNDRILKGFFNNLRQIHSLILQKL